MTVGSRQDPPVQPPFEGWAQERPRPPVAAVIPAEGRLVRVLPDVVGIDREFDYLVADGVDVNLGDVVRVSLGGRKVGGWVTALDVEPAAGVVARPVGRVSGRGPNAELIDLAAWAARRWAGRRATFMRSASPSAVVDRIPEPAPSPTPGASAPPPGDPSATEAFDRPLAVLRWPPGADRYSLVRAAVSAPSPVAGGRCLVLCPSVDEAHLLGERLRRDGVATAIVAHHGPGGRAGARQWAQAAAGAVVVGARAGAWAPVARLGRVVVLDEHDEAYQGDASPTWNARDVAIERARRAGAPCLLVSPTPSLEALAIAPEVVPARPFERAGWPRVEVVDQRELDPALGPLFSPALVRLVRGSGRVVCVLNRTGRARLLACVACSSIARCTVCEAAVGQPGGPDELVCPRCRARRPEVCIVCGSNRFKALRLGVGRAAEELAALAGQPVLEVTAATALDDPGLGASRLLLGTEAVLHRVARADAVAFLDFDQELLAPRFRAGELALGLLARAGRLVARAGREGRVLVQTRVPDHPAIAAAVRADPKLLVDAEVPLRAQLGLPPSSALALVSGPAAAAFVQALGQPELVTVLGPVDGTWRLQAPDHDRLGQALSAVARPPGRLRIEVDPLRA